MVKVGAIAVLVGLLLAGLLWIGGEMHYRNCIDAATATTPPPRAAEASSTQEDIDRALAGKPPAQPADTSRAEAVAGCSRWPF